MVVDAHNYEILFQDLHYFLSDIVLRRIFGSKWIPNHFVDCDPTRVNQNVLSHIFRRHKKGERTVSLNSKCHLFPKRVEHSNVYVYNDKILCENKIGKKGQGGASEY